MTAIDLSLINRSCVITNRTASGTEDDYGNEIPSTSTIETVCEIQQRRREERGDQGEVSDTDWVGFFLPDELIRTSDSIAVDGEAYEVVGEPWRARDPFDRQVTHIEASLRRTAGSQDEVGS